VRAAAVPESGRVRGSFLRDLAQGTHELQDELQEEGTASNLASRRRSGGDSLMFAVSSGRGILAVRPCTAVTRPKRRRLLREPGSGSRGEATRDDTLAVRLAAFCQPGACSDGGPRDPGAVASSTSAHSGATVRILSSVEHGGLRSEMLRGVVSKSCGRGQRLRLRTPSDIRF
jgi:hypothetical protein